MYRAPEMVDMYRNQEVGVKVDVWSLGCILYSLCFREHPFAEESSLQILNAAYTIPADSPYLPRMHKLIAALLQPDPAVRPHAKDVLAAVQQLRAAEATEGSKAPASAKSPAPATPSSAGSARSQARTHALHANSSESSGGAAPTLAAGLAAAQYVCSRTCRPNRLHGFGQLLGQIRRGGLRGL